jgi:ERCC4-type nuclease
MSHTYLVSDTRERHVHGFIETMFDEAGAAYTVAQINTGDYLICRRLAGGQPEILACIERKSLKDFAASFKDGRYENRLKMLDLRDKTGCQLYFFVEGPAYPKPTWKVSRIPYGSILSAMTNMMLRDGIHVVQTENEMGTAQRLLDFVRGFEKTDVPYTYPLADRGADEDEVVGGAPARSVEIPADGVPTMVMGTIEKSDDLLVVEVWAKLTGISMPTAQVVAEAFSVADLVTGQVTLEELDALRTRGGRQLVKKGKASLRALRRGVQKEEIKTLSGIPGISPAMATQILTTGGTGGTPVTLSAFLAYGPGAMAATSIRQKGRTVRLGDARAERIHRLMHRCAHRTANTGDDAPPADEGGVVVDVAPEPVQLRPEETLDDDELNDLLGL